MLALGNLSGLFFLLCTLLQFAPFASARSHFGSESILKRQSVGTSRLVTNAARMQAGLGPLKPRSLYHPSRVAARGPSPSNVPILGNIEVRDGGNNVLGYLADVGGGFEYQLTSTQSDGITVSFTSTAPFNIAVSGEDYPYLGCAGQSLSSDCRLTSTAATQPGATPQEVGNSYANDAINPGPGIYSESAIWSYDPSSQSLTAQWINPDGSQPSTFIVWSPNSSGIVLINSLANLGNLQEVFFFVVT